MRSRLLAVVLIVLSVTFILGARRRAVRSGPCDAPTLTLSVSPQVACPGAAVTVSWRASTERASVTIDGVGTNLRWVGSARVTNGQRSFTGFASNVCGRSGAALASVSAPEPPAGSISGPSLVRQFNTATLRVSVSDSTSWSLSSSLQNTFTPGSGVGSEEATYHASNAGTDGILLRLTGQCDSITQRTHSLVVERGSQPPPPPPTGYLRCCDGTTSPTCRDCNNKRGCCSNHGGVCGC